MSKQASFMTFGTVFWGKTHKNKPKTDWNSVPKPPMVQKYGSVAQLDRASPSEGEGHAFESRRVRQNKEAPARGFCCFGRSARKNASAFDKNATLVSVFGRPLPKARTPAGAKICKKHIFDQSVGSTISKKRPQAPLTVTVYEGFMLSSRFK